ncbi:MAG: McrB family protein [Bacillota bacterium]
MPIRDVPRKKIIKAMEAFDEEKRGLPDHQDLDFIDFVKFRGYNFDVDILKTYILALKTKPFVILSGISGTGKTKLAQFFAEYMVSGRAAQENKSKNEGYCFVSVRPDWVDNKGLLGHYNSNTQGYEATELLKLMLRAEKDTSNPYFAIFDEMNLSKVEHYFSDFLSCMESKIINKNGDIVSEPLILHSEKKDIPYIDEYGDEYLIPPKMFIPENIYFTGTVNIDGSVFSPKVIDRANIIELNKVDLEKYKVELNENLESRKKALNASPEFIAQFSDHSSFHKKLIVKDFDLDDEINVCIDHLKNINDILMEYNLHFGYRVVDEILFFICNSKKMGYYEPIVALDYQILQRILPKFQGNKKKLELAFSNLLRYYFGLETNYRNTVLTKNDFECIRYILNHSTIEIPSVFYNSVCYFPNSSAKLLKMLAKVTDDGVVAFIE